MRVKGKFTGEIREVIEVFPDGGMTLRAPRSGREYTYPADYMERYYEVIDTVREEGAKSSSKRKRR